MISASIGSGFVLGSEAHHSVGGMVTNVAARALRRLGDCNLWCSAEAKRFIIHAWFDRAILFFIIVNCIFLCMDDVTVEYGTDFWQMLRWAELIFTWFFAAEMCLKVHS